MINLKKYMFFLLLILLIPKNIYAYSDTSRSTVVMDVDSGRVLYKKNPNEKRLIASITKIMTATIAIENSNVNKKITVGEEVLKMYGTNTYIEPGEKISIKDLIYGLILRSGNDSAIAISYNVGNGKFVDMMNEKAKELKMYGTVFSNPHGLDEETENYSTAMDMAKLASYSYKKLPLYREITGTYKYSLKTNKKSYTWYNRNKLLKKYKYCVGGKTGYTPKAGKTLVSYAKKDNLVLTAVSLKDSNHYETHESLYEYLFDKYKNYKIIDSKNKIVSDTYYKDKLYVKEDYYYPLRQDELDKIKTIVKINKLKNYKDNEKVGEIEIKLGDDHIKNIDIFVNKDKKKKKSFFSSLFNR